MANHRFSRLLKILAGSDDEALVLSGRGERWLHFWGLVGRQFVRNRCLVRAEALSYSSLLALIPLLAVALGVTSTLLKNQDEERFYSLVDRFVASVTPPAELSSNTPASTAVAAGTNDLALATNTLLSANGLRATNAFTGTNDVAVTVPSAPPVNTAQLEIARQIRHFVEHTSSSTLGVTGMILLVIVAISMLMRIEATFNDIWGVAKGRHWLRQILLFWAVITLGPPLLVTALGLAGEGHLTFAKAMIAHTPLVGALVFKLLPLAMLWLTFTLIYLLVPNTKVNFSAAFVGGLAGGSLWQLNNLFGFLYVSRVATNLNIYGGLGLVPVFMIGLYLSWCILLFGAQVAYAFQNRSAYFQDRLAENVNQRGREFVALRVMAALGRRFQDGLPPASVIELSAGLAVPSRLTEAILVILVQAQLVTEVAGEESTYAPARPLERINAYDILSALRTGDGQELPDGGLPELQAVYGEFARVEQAERETAGRITLLSLVQRTSGTLPPAPGRPELVPLAAVPAAIPLPPVADGEMNPVGKPGAAPEATKTSPAYPPAAQPEETDFPL